MPYDANQYQAEKESGLRLPSGATRLTRLTGKHLRCINFHLQGMKGGVIAEVMNVSPAWVSKILTDPLSKVAIQERFVEIDNEMFTKATRTVDEKMDHKDPAIALRAADMVWRARGRYEKKTDDRPTAEDVVQRMLQLASQQGKASVTISAAVGESQHGGERSELHVRSNGHTIDGEVL